MYRILVQLMDPFLVLMLAVAVSLLLLYRRRVLPRRRLAPVSAAFGLLWFLCLPCISHLTLGTLEWAYSPRAAMPASETCIVVLGGALRPPNPQRSWTELESDTLNRCVEAERLWRQQPHVQILVSGGKVDPTTPGPTLAHQMAYFLRQHGVPDDQIIVEEHSSTTYQNAVESAKLLRELGTTHCVLVTDATHMLRAERCFAKQAIDVSPAAANFRAEFFEPNLCSFLPSAAAARTQGVVLHEWMGLLWYRLCDRI